MQEISPSKIKIPALNQVAFVVNEVEKVAENYWNILGIGPWDIFTLEPPNVFNQTYHTKPANYGQKIGLCKCGSCQLELIQPTLGDSMYRDFIAQHGEGLQHLQYLAETVDEAKKHAQLLAEQGFPLIMDGQCGDGYWAYIDTTSALKCVWEVAKMPSSISAPHIRIPPNPDQKSPAKIKVQGVAQVSLMVKDVEETMKNYWEILGIGPWDVINCSPPVAHDLLYKGKPASFSWKVALVMLGEIQLELIEPTEGESIYTDFLSKQGEGLQHLQFFSLDNDIGETNQMMSEAGFPVLMGGGFADGKFAYYDTIDDLKCIIEALQVPKGMPPTTRYP